MCIARYRALVDRLRADAPDEAAWLEQGLARMREGEDLARALDLVGRGAQRAAHDDLRRAARLLKPDGPRSWAAAVALLAALKDLARRDSLHRQRPPVLDEADLALRRAQLNYPDLPTSLGGMYRVLSSPD